MLDWLGRILLLDLGIAVIVITMPCTKIMPMKPHGSFSCFPNLVMQPPMMIWIHQRNEGNKSAGDWGQGMTIDLLEPVVSLEEIEGSAVFLPS